MDHFKENEFQTRTLVSHLTNEEQVAFYKQTYSHVAGGVLVFILFEYLLLQSETMINFTLSMLDGWRWLIMLGGFMFITNYAESMALRTADKNKQYLAYGLYILAEAFIFLPLIYFAVNYTNSEVLLKQAVIVTLSLFTGLSAVVLVTKKDFSFLKAGLTVGFFIAIGLILAGAIFNSFHLGLWFSVGMCVLAAGSILYQTSNMVHKYSRDQYIPAALGLFAALMLLFWYILRIFMSRD